jgi:hypothetical protein
MTAFSAKTRITRASALSDSILAVSAVIADGFREQSHGIDAEIFIAAT